MFDSNGEHMFNVIEFFNAYVEKFPIGMKRKYAFYELPYWEHLKIAHLLDPMHIFKNVSSSLWRCLSSKESDTLDVRRDLVSSKTKEKHWPRQETRGEVGPSWYFKEGDVAWILNKYDLSLEKEFIMNVRLSSLYGSSLWLCFIVDDHLLGLKLHDYLNLLRVFMSKT